MWDFIKRIVGAGKPQAKKRADPESQVVHPPQVPGKALGKPANIEIPRLGSDQNPWKIPVIDVRPITHTLLSSSTDPQCAKNAISYGQDDGRSFIGMKPSAEREVPLSLTYRCDGILADGALFIPGEMEHKWAIYHFKGSILFIRGWLRQVYAIATCEYEAGLVRLTALRGAFVFEAQEEREFSERVADFLIRTHVLEIPWPAPLPAGDGLSDYLSALWCMNVYGNKATVASRARPDHQIPDKPVRSFSLLHIATARGNLAEVDQQLAAGLPIELRDAQGLTPIHWAIVRSSPDMVEPILARGANPNARSDEGATPLMNAVQGNHFEHAVILLQNGAAADERDNRGFSALHRAAEMGLMNMVELLLKHGASPSAEAAGHTPISFATDRGHAEIVAKLKASQG